MAYVLTVHIPETESVEFVLEDGRYKIGSIPESDIQIAFEEVANVAAHLEVRGEAVFIRNLNPYSIYVGDQELHSSQQGEWPSGQLVLLTQSVSLELHDQAEQSASVQAADSAKRARSTFQIAVMVACVGAAFFLLSTENTAPDSTASLQYSFTDMVQKIEQDKTRKYVAVLNYMIDARMSDLRWGTENPKRAMSAYSMLLDEPLIRDAPSGGDSVEGQIKQFALARLADLSRVAAKLRN